MKVDLNKLSSDNDDLLINKGWGLKRSKLNYQYNN